MEEHARKTILIVSSDLHSRQALVDLLHGAGYDVAVAPGPAQVLGPIRAGAVDVVVADMCPPACDGMVILEELQQARLKLPVVLVSTVSEVETYLEAMNRGAFEYLVQPVSATEFLAVVRKALEWSPRRRRAA